MKITQLRVGTAEGPVMQIPAKLPPVARFVAHKPTAPAPKAFSAVLAKPSTALTPPPKLQAQAPAAHPRIEKREEPAHHEEKKNKREPIDPALDPTARNPALVPPPVTPPAPATIEATAAPRARMSMEELLPALVRRIAWAGDKNKGTVRMELGAGAHAGTTILVHADGGRVRVELSGAGDLDSLRRTLDERLRGHGLDVESVT